MWNQVKEPGNPFELVEEDFTTQISSYFCSLSKTDFCVIVKRLCYPGLCDWGNNSLCDYLYAKDYSL